MHLISTNYMTLPKKNCARARTGIFQDVFKLQERSFKQHSEGEKVAISGLVSAISMKVYFYIHF